MKEWDIAKFKKAKADFFFQKNNINRLQNILLMVQIRDFALFPQINPRNIPCSLEIIMF